MAVSVATNELKNFDRDTYQGLYQDHTGTKDEPHVGFIQDLAANGLSKLGHHGPMGTMGVSRNELPSWHDIQINMAQLHRLSLRDDAKVGADLVIGENAK